MLHGIKPFTLNYINSLQVAELKQEAGKISNLELQRKVVRVFYYLCVVTLQYTAPMILILYLCFLYKTLGGGSWTGGFTPATFSESGGQAAAAGAELDSEFQEVEVADTREMDIGIGTIIQQEESVEAIKHQFSLAWISVKNVRNSFCSKIFHFLSCIKKKFFRFSPRRCSEGCSASPPGGAVLSGSPPPPSESDTSHTSIKSKFHLKIIH